METLTVRRLGSDDLDWIDSTMLAVLQSASFASTYALPNEEEFNVCRAYWSAALKNTSDGVLLGLFVGNTNDFAGVLYATRDDVITYVHALHVMPQVRRRGGGRALLEELERLEEFMLLDPPSKTIELVIDLRNIEALAFYEALGFMPRVGTNGLYKNLQPKE